MEEKTKITIIGGGVGGYPAAIRFPGSNVGTEREQRKGESYSGFRQVH